MIDPASGEPDVLVVGAGPVGLAPAREPRRHGVRCRVIDLGHAPTPPNQSRALAMHARTLEALRDLGVADRALSEGREVHAVGAYSDGRRVVHLVFDLEGADTPYPYALGLPQSTSGPGREDFRPTRSISGVNDSRPIMVVMSFFVQLYRLCGSRRTPPRRPGTAGPRSPSCKPGGLSSPGITGHLDRATASRRGGPAHPGNPGPSSRFLLDRAGGDESGPARDTSAPRRETAGGDSGAPRSSTATSPQQARAFEPPRPGSTVDPIGVVSGRRRRSSALPGESGRRPKYSRSSRAAAHRSGSDRWATSLPLRSQPWRVAARAGPDWRG